jgi:L-threonylcarbamoyladenylate synthase
MKSILKMAQIINRPGSVVVIATDTVYGLVARAKDPQAVDRLYKLKNREDKPGTLIARSIEQLVELGFKRKYLVSVEQFWPGPVSVIIPCANQALDYLKLGRPDIALRIPNDQKLLGLLELTGPMITSSANLPNQPPANTISQAKAYFDNKVDAYFNGGDLSGRQPSTIIRVVDDAVEVVRQGSVNIENS